MHWLYMGRGVCGYRVGSRAGPHSASSPLGTGSGSIDADELRTVLQSCMRESAISLPDEKLDQLTLALFESADKDNNGAITFDELRNELQRFPGVMENLTIRCGPVSSVGTARVGVTLQVRRGARGPGDPSAPPQPGQPGSVLLQPRPRPTPAPPQAHPSPAPPRPTYLGPPHRWPAPATPRHAPPYPA